MKTNSLNFLLALVMLFFASCQKESLNLMDEAGALTSMASKNLNAARTAAECAASSLCIDPENPVYFPEEGDFSGTFGSNSKNIHYKVYNTLTGFEVELTYTRSSGKAATAVEVTVGSQSTVLLLTIPQTGTTTIKHTFSLPEGWDACDALAWSITEVATTILGVTYNPSGDPIAGSGTYYLYGACGCEESFIYKDNGDKTYTFTYTPEEDVEDALLVFTFAQGVAETATGLDGWDVAGSTRQTTMDLVACETYTWTVGLQADCSGNSGNSNVWTDFKVGIMGELVMEYDSKKADPEDKFIQSCP